MGRWHSVKAVTRSRVSDPFPPCLLHAGPLPAEKNLCVLLGSFGIVPSQPSSPPSFPKQSPTSEKGRSPPLRLERTPFVPPKPPPLWWEKSMVSVCADNAGQEKSRRWRLLASGTRRDRWRSSSSSMPPIPIKREGGGSAPRKSPSVSISPHKGGPARTQRRTLTATTAASPSATRQEQMESMVSPSPRAGPVC